MPAKKKTTKTAKSNAKPSLEATRANKLTVVIICSLLVLVGIFLVYKSFAASVLVN